MKNVILTHKELQLNLFMAVTFGLRFRDFGKHRHLIHDITEREYVWKVVECESRESSAIIGKPVFFWYVNKGEYQMNDLRIGVTIGYLHDQAEKFINEYEDYIVGNLPPKVEENQVVN